MPHVTLKSIANNEEIDAIHERWQPRLDALLEKLNAVFRTTWEEWEVPREAPSEPSPRAAGKGSKAAGPGPSEPSPRGAGRGQGEGLLKDWWQLRRERQAEIDASIARRADTELLYDQPYEDDKRIRVTGPFTVESLSPHRVLSADEERPAAEREARRRAQHRQLRADDPRQPQEGRRAEHPQETSA